MHAGQLLGAAAGDAEAGDDLVEDEQSAGRGRLVAQQLEEALGRRDEAHVRRVGLAQDGGELVLLGRRPDGGGIVPRHDHGVRGRRGRDARAGGEGLGREAAARLGEQAVDVPVVGPGELQELLAAGRRAGEPDGAHRGLGARRRHPQHRDGGHAPRDLVGEVDLGDRRRAERRAALRPPRPQRRRPRDGRGRGRAGPRSRPSRRSGCRRRRRSRRRRRARRRSACARSRASRGPASSTPPGRRVTARAYASAERVSRRETVTELLTRRRARAPRRGTRR